jgi:histidine triad (HIT) family protein
MEARRARRRCDPDDRRLDAVSGAAFNSPEQCVNGAAAMGYDETNIFARILRGELPAHKIYEDTETLAFMDIMPRCEGHALVIPKTPARNLLDANPDQLSACLSTVQKIARAQLKAFNADGITVQQFNEPAGGQVVFHLHYHVLPRWDGVRLGPHTGQMEKPEILAAAAAKLKAALGS